MRGCLRSHCRYKKSASALWRTHISAAIRDFTFVKDAVAATIAAATKGVPGRVFNIRGGSRVSVNEVLDLIGRIAGRRPVVRVDPAQKGDMRHTYADTSLARADLGFAPTVALEEGLAAEYQWLTEIL